MRLEAALVLESTGTEGFSGASCKAHLIFSALVAFLCTLHFVICIDLDFHIEFVSCVPGQMSWDSVLNFSNLFGQPGTDFPGGLPLAR